MQRSQGLWDVRKKRPLLPGVASDSHMVAPRLAICTFRHGFRCGDERARSGRPICGSVLSDDRRNAPENDGPASDSDALRPGDNEQEQESSRKMDQLSNDESGAQGAQGLTSAWSDPDWTLLSDVPGAGGPSAGLRRTLDEGHVRGDLGSEVAPWSE